MTLPSELDPSALCLHPFDPHAAPGPLRLGASLRRQGERLEIRWRLQGALAGLRLPEPVAEPQRRDALWTSTCLECFLARPDEAGYWELNLCPSGHWTLYRLDGYRRGLRPEAAIQCLESRRLISHCQPSCGEPSLDQPSLAQASGEPKGNAAAGEEQVLELALDLDLEALLSTEASDAALQLGVTAVLESVDGAISYWALAHPAPEADFHHRAGFCVQLPAPVRGWATPE
ncbi:MAG: DOMON-like domain-containing protein [Synechococcaceae cyanobacterium]